MKFGGKSITYFTFFYLCSINGVYFNIVGVFFFDAVAISPVTGQCLKNTK